MMNNKNPDAAEENTAEQLLPASLAKDQPQNVMDVEAVSKKTRAPRRFTEATLLTAMETAGKTLDEKELSDAMKETGLGTPATRASIIEVLLKREYIIREGKSLAATDKWIRLIEVVHPEVKSPAMTGQWEAYLKRIQRGSAQMEPFLRGIEEYVTKVVGKTGSVVREAPQTPVLDAVPPPPTQIPQPRMDFPSTSSLVDILHSGFGFSSFRPNQETVCRTVAEKKPTSEKTSDAASNTASRVLAESTSKLVELKLMFQTYD